MNTRKRLPTHEDVLTWLQKHGQNLMKEELTHFSELLSELRSSNGETRKSVNGFYGGTNVSINSGLPHDLKTKNFIEAQKVMEQSGNLA